MADEQAFAPMSDERRQELLAAMERWFADRALAVELVRELAASERYWYQIAHKKDCALLAAKKEVGDAR